MRRPPSRSHESPSAPYPQGRRIDGWQTISRLAPYLLQYRWRVALALSCLIAAKCSNVAVPIVFKSLIDGVNAAALPTVLPVGLLMLYGVLRVSNSLFTELREVVFARVTQRAVRKVALEVFRHLHDLSLRFHLDRQTGGVARDIDRGTRAITSLISYTLYSILPTLVELSLVLGVLTINYDRGFVFITLVSIGCYIVFTVTVSNRRIAIRRAANDADSVANTQAIDSLINYETVKYFNNEDFEAARYDRNLLRWEDATTRSQYSLSALNLGQQAIIALGVTAMMWRAVAGVLAGTMTIGDLVLVNAFLIQLYLPLNFLGIVYREIRQALTDIERMFDLLNTAREVVDAPNARTLPHGELEIRFSSVDFAYDADRQILFGVDFAIPKSRTVAVVGKSGSGKLTLARLLYRFYDVSGGAIRANGHDIREFTQASVRAAIGIVPQDTVLFNESIFYNIQYGRPDATRDEVLAAARAAQLTGFVEQLPAGFDTVVGERGLKLSGGEKQRVAIARALLKDPALLIFDEATSALDSKTENAIKASIESATRGRTTLVIAHRLSTVMYADEILVMDAGRIAERGTHPQLLQHGGRYAQMWALQQRDGEDENARLAEALA
ncbi:MAG: ABC transporter ATP-binding protein/permease [Propionivibrio sp.]